MRIGIDTQSSLGRKTGIGQYTALLLEALVQIAPQHEYVTLQWGRDPVMRLDRRLRWQQFELPRRARASGSDVLHVPGFDAPFWKPCPVVLTVHDLIGVLFPNNFPPAARFYWSRWLPASVRNATHVVADSEHTRHDLINLLGVHESRVTVVPLAAGAQYRPVLDPAAVQAVRHRYTLPQRFILFVGTVEPRKGLDTLVDAFARVRGTYEDIGLVIAGKRGWYTARLFADIGRLGLAETVIFTDYVRDEDLPALYCAADVLALPSRYEGFGLTVLEAMACGTPVVCSNSSSLPEVAGDAAIMVPPGEPDSLAEGLSQALASEDMRRCMRERGIAQAARFSWLETARRTLSVYERAGRHRSS